MGVKGGEALDDDASLRWGWTFKKLDIIAPHQPAQHKEMLYILHTKSKIRNGNRE